MHELLLLRHAKSSSKTGAADDFKRPLSKRGRKDCKRMGNWLADQGLAPDLIVSSTAVRARQTAERICKRLNYALADVQWEDKIYGADARALLKILSGVDEAKSRVLLIGHHEGLDTLILRMSDWSDIPADPKLLPTAAVARFEIDSRWAQIKNAKAKLKSIIKPRELAKATT